jgi:hypothetical protein
MAAEAPVCMEAAATPVADLLARMADEFRELSGVAETLQDLPARLGRLDASGVMLAQTIDMLSQRLHGLAAFSEALSALMPASWHVDPTPAAALITLSDLQRRLTRAQLAEAELETADEMELF